MALLSAAGVALCSAFAFGLNNGMLNSPAAVIRADFNISDESGDVLWSLCVAIYSLGALIGCNRSPVLSDRHGRRKFIHANATLYVAGAVLQAGAKLFADASAAFGLILFVLGRAVVGIASGGSTVVVPLYLGECAPATLRGKLGTAFQVTVTLSMLTAQVLGLGALLGTSGAWPVLLLSPVVPCVVQLVLHAKLLESPRWLASKGRAREAAALAQQLHAGHGGGDDEVGGSGGESAAAESAGDGGAGGATPAPVSISELVRLPRWRAPLRFCVITMCVQQFSGINNAFNYSSSFLRQNGVGEGVVTGITVAMNVANVAVTCAAAWLIDRVGRRPLLLGSTAAMVATILLLTVGLALPPSDGASALIALAVIAYVGSFGCGQGPVPWMLPAELFPTHARATAGGLAAACNWLSNFVVAQLFLALAAGMHAYAFVPFALVLIGFGIYAYKTMPETRGKSLEELAHAFAPIQQGSGGGSMMASLAADDGGMATPDMRPVVEGGAAGAGAPLPSAVVQAQQSSC